MTPTWSAGPGDEVKIQKAIVNAFVIISWVGWESSNPDILPFYVCHEFIVNSRSFWTHTHIVHASLIFAATKVLISNGARVTKCVFRTHEQHINDEYSIYAPIDLSSFIGRNNYLIRIIPLPLTPCLQRLTRLVSFWIYQCTMHNHCSEPIALWLTIGNTKSLINVSRSNSTARSAFARRITIFLYRMRRSHTKCA